MSENIGNVETGSPAQVPDIPYIAHESAMAREERKHQRLVRALIVAILALLISNGVWLWAWLQYDYVSDTITVESTATGHANYIAGDGDITNGEGGSQKAP